MLEYISSQYILNDMYPAKNRIFRPFITDYDDLKVVILTHEPCDNELANGLGMGITEEIGKSCPGVDQIEGCLEREVKNGLFFMDYSMENWAKQGVLLLNTSLTTIQGNKDCHSFYWRPFISRTLKELSKRKTGIIYCLWGTQAQSFEKYIDPKTNYIMKASLPGEAKGEWNCSHFNDINKIIRDNNGQEFCINW